MKSKCRGFTTSEMAFLLIWVAAITGWILNVVWIVEKIHLPITKMFILRCVGVLVAPLGAVLGYI